MLEDLRRSPICLTVPGLGNSGPAHWQTIWEQERHDCTRVELGCWDAPVRNVWIGRLDEAVRHADAPVVLVAHSLGCLAVAWWAGLLGEDVTGPVRGALLVAPPDADRPGACEAIKRFRPTPHAALPFPTIVVASTDDPYASISRSEEMAAAWRADFVVVEEGGHLNAESGLGRWSTGQALLDRLADQDGTRPLRVRLSGRAPRDDGQGLPR
jgi:uncharacterized protein